MTPPVHTTPLVDRKLEDWIAFSESRINVGSFLSQARSIAAQLPDPTHAINLCHNRYRFFLAFCAVILRGGCNLLPPNKFPATQLELAIRYPDCYVLHDGAGVADSLESFDMRDAAMSGPNENVIPEVRLDQLCAISFTSGSTGKSAANPKTWRTLREGAKLNAHYYLDANKTGRSLLATVPPQHMFGLETSITLPLVADVCFCDSQWLFPEDVRAGLGKLPESRVLVSTPAHLRAMVGSGLRFPKTHIVLCATAPMEKELAISVEQLFDAKLIEIYGCSEAGSVAWRRTANEQHWTQYDEFSFETKDNVTTLTADHIGQEISLQDVLQTVNKRQFELRGRHSDMINIAGKRGTLTELNEILLNTIGVVDGVIFEREESLSADSTQRLAALVVAPDKSSKQVLEKLRERVDPVFIPRPVLFVDQLPRSETGKLPRATLLQTFNRLINKSS